MLFRSAASRTNFWIWIVSYYFLVYNLSDVIVTLSLGWERTSEGEFFTAKAIVSQLYVKRPN